MDEQRKNPYRRAPRDPDAPRRPARDAADPGNASSPSEVGGRKGLRRLPSDLQDLADGTVDRLRRPRSAPSPLEDTREGAVIGGVRNAEARVVYDSRVSKLRAALAAGRDAEVADGLRQVKQLALWRARNVTDFEAFAESVVGVPAGTTQSLLALGDDGSASDAPALPAEAVALLIRVEAALLQRPPGGRVSLRHEPDGRGLTLTLALSVNDVGLAIEGLSDVGRATAALRRFIRPDALPPASEQRGYGRDAERPRRPARDDGRSDSRGGGPARGGSWNARGPRRDGAGGGGGGGGERRGPPSRDRDNRGAKPPPKRRRP